MEYVVQALLSLVVMVASGVIVWQAKRKRPRLHYEIVESEPFPRQGGKGKYFVIGIHNSGNTPVRNTDLRITFDSGTMDSVAFSDDTLIQDVTQTASQLTGLLPLLNPNEALSLTITTTPGEGAPPPRVRARAVGVTAVPKPTEAHVASLLQALAGMSLGLAVGISLTVALFQPRMREMWERQRRTQGRIEQAVLAQAELQAKVRQTEARVDDWVTKREQGLAEAPEIIFAALNRSGLSHLVPDLLATGRADQYWSAALFLMHRFLASPAERDKYVAAIADMLKAKDVGPSSRGFMLYLLAKMEQARGNNDRAAEHFGACKSEAPLMYELLISQDPAYDVSRLTDALLRQRDRAPGGGGDTTD